MVNIIKDNINRSINNQFRYVLIYSKHKYFKQYTDDIVTSRNIVQEFKTEIEIDNRIKELGFEFVEF